MTDTSVHITSSDLPEWATETTLNKLASAMEDLLDLSAEQKNQLKSGFKEMKQTGKATADSMKKAGGGGNIFKDSTSGLQSFTKELNEGSVSLDSLDEPVEKFGKGLSSTAKRLGIIGGAFALFGQQIGLAIGDIKETVGALRNMTDVGIQVKGGFDGLRDTMAQTGMSLEEVSNITSTYTRTVGNVGLRGILDLTKATEDSSFQFREYGLLVAEGAEFQAKMLESQRLGGIFRAQDQRANSMALQENIKNLTAYSNILNISREEMAQAQVEAKSRADVMRKFNSMDEDSRKSANQSFDQFTAITASLGEGGKEMQQMMIDMIASPVAEASESFQALAQVSPETAQAVKKLQQDIMSGADISPDMIITQMTEVLDAASQSGQIEMLALGDQTRDVANMMGGPLLNALRNYEANLARAEGATMEEKLANMAQSTDGAVSAAVGLDQELRRLSQSIKSSRIDKFMQMFGEEAAAGVESLTTVISKAADMVDWFGDASWEDIGQKIVDTFHNIVWPAVQGLFASASDWLSRKIEDAFLWIRDIPVEIGNAIARSPIGDLLGMTVQQLPSEARAMVESGYNGSPTSTGNVDLDQAVRAQVARERRVEAGTAGAATAQGMTEYEAMRLKQGTDLQAAMDKLRRDLLGANGQSSQ